MQDRIGAIRRALVSVALGATLSAMLSVSGWSAGCSTCAAIKGIEIDDKLGTTSVLPVTAGVNIGLGSPYRVDKKNMPSAGYIRYYVPPSPEEPYIKWDNSIMTFTAMGRVKIGRVEMPGWSWQYSDCTLTTPNGSEYKFNRTSGNLTRSSGANGQRLTYYTYDANFSDRIASVTDSYGNTWTYGVDANSCGPTYVIDPDGTRKVGFTYKATGTNGTGQYDIVTVYKLSGSAWVEQEHTSYTYDASSRVTQVSTVTATDTSTSNITYSGDYVSRVENSQLKYDMTYGYSTENITTSGGTYSYGVVTIRHRSTYGQDTNSSDQVIKYYYYLDDNTKNRYLFRQVSRVFDGSVWSDYATTEYRRYGYNDRFTDTDKPTSEVATLQAQPWKVVDPRGNATKYAYASANGEVTKTTLATGDYSQTWYKQINSQDSAFVEKTRDSRGKYARYTRDSTNPSLVTKVEVSDDDSTYTTVKEMSYYSTPSHKQGLLYQETIPDIEGTDDKVTTYDYQETIGTTVYYRPNPTTVSYPWWNGSSYETKTSTTSYYKDGRIRFTKDALNNQTDYNYDAMLRSTQTWLPADSADSGSVSSNTSTVVTDTAKSWLQDQLVGMALQVTSGAYSGNIYTITGNTATTVTISGSLPSLTGATYAVRPFTESHYLACCNLADWEQDASGKKTYNTYDSERRILAETRNDVTGSNSANPLVKYTYNDLGQKKEERTYKDSSDTTGRLTLYTYDQLGRMSKIVYPNNDGTRLLWDEYYQYDLNNNQVAKLVGIVDGSGNITAGSVTAYEYDSLNRLTKVKNNYSTSTWPISNMSISNESISYQYDGGSRLKTQIVDGSGTSSYIYDTEGNLKTYTPSIPLGHSVEYTYNVSGDKTSVIVKSGGTNKFQTLYSYFKNDWLKQVKGQEWVSGAWSDVTRSDFAYDAAGNRSQRRDGLSLDDIRSEYAYNSRGELKRIQHFDPSNTEQYGMTYKRDGAGNPLAVDFVGLNCPAVYQNKTVSYAYDATSRLTSETVGNGTPATWSYDWVGNRGMATDSNAVDEYLADNGRVYDKLGNLTHVPNATASTRTDYSYTPDFLLHQVTDFVSGVGTTTTMTWGADHQRVRLQSGARDWRFIYDPTVSIPAILFTSENTYGDEAFFVREPGGELLSSYGNWGPLNYHYDAIGSDVLVSDNAGSVVDDSAYGAWGDTAESLNAIAPYRFVGQLGYYSHEAGLVGAGLGSLMQLGVRFYDPEIGRFTSRDPAKDGLNWYGYVEGRPTSLADPTGLLPPIPHPPFYGRYCGSQYPPGTGTPVDALDTCCQNHDNCFINLGCLACTQVLAGMGRCRTICNVDLCACAKAASCARSKHPTACALSRWAVINYSCNVVWP